MEKSHIVELVKWRSKPGVSDEQMIFAVDDILPDLETLPGFISQKLYKDDDGPWVDLYHWDTREQAIASNDLMAPRASFGALMDLIEPESVSIEFLTLCPKVRNAR